MNIWTLSANKILFIKEWTWISGGNEDKQLGKYGMKGKQSKTNIPGSRQISASWIDDSDQKLYLFGGIGYGMENTSYGLFYLKS